MQVESVSPKEGDFLHVKIPVTDIPCVDECICVMKRVTGWEVADVSSKHDNNSVVNALLLYSLANSNENNNVVTLKGLHLHAMLVVVTNVCDV